MKSGFVSLIGRTNAGKSSLLNYLLGEKISMVSHKVNATRRKINGIVMHNENQIIFIDTPGLHDSNKVMNQMMVEVALKSIGDSDLVVFLATIHDSLQNYEKFLELNKGVKHIVILTKIDLAKPQEVINKLLEYQKYQNEFLSILPVSTKKKIYKNEILVEISKHLPEHEYFYDPEFISTTNVRDIYRDFILEAIFENTSNEIPYCTDVIIDRVIEDDQNPLVLATIVTDSNSHKQILIGKDGYTVKRIGITSRKLISNFSNSKISVKLNIIVKKNWKNDKNLIKKAFIY